MCGRATFSRSSLWLRHGECILTAGLVASICCRPLGAAGGGEARGLHLAINWVCRSRLAAAEAAVRVVAGVCASRGHICTAFPADQCFTGDSESRQPTAGSCSYTRFNIGFTERLAALCRQYLADCDMLASACGVDRKWNGSSQHLRR